MMMPTKAELEAELAELKRKLADGAETVTDAEESVLGDGPAALAEMLKSHGLDPGDLDLDRLWRQITEDFGDMQRKHPALTAITVFALGFLLGRMSR